MITKTRIAKLRELEGAGWVTALKAPAGLADNVWSLFGNAGGGLACPQGGEQKLGREAGTDPFP